MCVWERYRCKTGWLLISWSDQIRSFHVREIFIYIRNLSLCGVFFGMNSTWKIVRKCMTYEKLSCEVHVCSKCDTISKWLILVVCLKKKDHKSFFFSSSKKTETNFYYGIWWYLGVFFFITIESGFFSCHYVLRDVFFWGLNLPLKNQIEHVWRKFFSHFYFISFWIFFSKNFRNFSYVR